MRDQYHNELQWYTGRRPENAWVSDGTLKITARREDKWADAPYTSARLNTRGKGDFKYGRIEASPRDPPASETSTMIKHGVVHYMFSSAGIPRLPAARPRGTQLGSS